MQNLSYFAVFGVLVGVTAGELVLVGLPGVSPTVIVTSLIGLAGFKALLVAAFFQGLKDEPRPLSTVLLVGIVIAMVLMSISFLQLHPFQTSHP